ncbi:MAG: hypothetical protein V3576_07440 [Candidatus Cloacimonadota bacterium]
MVKQGLMVRIGLCLVVSLILASSGVAWADTTGAATESGSGQKESYSAAECDSLANLLIGQWINKPYLDELIRSKSPQRAIEALRTMGEFRIVRYGLSSLGLQGTDFHSGMGQGIELIPNDSLIFSGIRLSSTKANTLYSPAYSSTPREMIEFIRVPSLEECVNNVLITGEYYDIDNPGNKLLFSADGVVTGLENFRDIDYSSDTKPAKYYIMLDSFASDHDRILFGDYNDNGRMSCYIYEIQDDTLLLYDSYEKFGLVDRKGELCYRLRRLR